MSRITRLGRTSLAIAARGYTYTLLKYPERPIKRQRSLRASAPSAQEKESKNTKTPQLQYDPNITNFDVIFLNKKSQQQKYYQIKLVEKKQDMFACKRKIFIYNIQQPRKEYLQFKCKHKDCNSKIIVHFKDSINNITKFIVLGNIHNHDCDYDESQYKQINNIKLKLKLVHFIKFKINCHITDDFVWYFSTKNKKIIWFDGSKYYNTRTKDNTYYYKCEHCNSTIILRKDDDNIITYSEAHVQCQHKKIHRDDMDRVILYRNIIAKNKDKLQCSNLKDEYESECKEMIKQTGSAVSFNSIKHRLYQNIPKDKQQPTCIDTLVKALKQAGLEHLINEKWNTIVVEDSDIVFYTDHGLGRVKDSENIGIDGNFKAKPNLKVDGDYVFSQLMCIVPMYVR